MEDNHIKVGLADDHTLFRQGMVNLINNVPEFQVIVEADSGESFLDKLTRTQEPDIAIIDIKMKGMDGFEVVEKLTEKYPNIKAMALSMYNDERSIIKMLKAGAKGYLLKGAEPWELTQAIKSTYIHGFYNGDVVNKALLSQLGDDKKFELKDYEIRFLKLCCSEKTYKEIAIEMEVSHRTIDGYRDRLFDKIEVSSRVGLVLFAIKHDIYKLI